LFHDGNSNTPKRSSDIALQTRQFTDNKKTPFRHTVGQLLLDYPWELKLKSSIQADVVTFGDIFQTSLIIEAKIHSAIKEVVHRNPYQVARNL
jgi:hypothetical protein